MTQFTKLVVSDGCFTELQNNWKSNRVVNAQTNYKTATYKSPAPVHNYMSDRCKTKKVYFVRIDPVDEVVTKWFF